MKKNKISNILIALVFLAGLSLMLYPSVSDYVNSRHQSRAIQSYEDAVSASLEQDKTDKIFEDAYDYNKRLKETPNSFYHPEMVSGYDSTLDITGTGIIGYITIEAIDVELPIYHSVDASVLQIAVGHLQGTGLPVGGEGNHSVLSGHRGLPSAKLFTDLDKLQEGDIFYITILNQVFKYQINQIKTVLPTEIDDILPVEGKDYCTVMTCTPYGINSHRLLLRGERITDTEEKSKKYIPNEAYQIDPIIVAPIMATPVFLILALILMIQSIRKTVRDRKK